MEKALYINEVYEEVLEEIMKSQEKNAGKIFYLQSYSEASIKQLKKAPPTPHSPLPLYISTTAQLNQICYSAEIVGWEDKHQITSERLALLNEHIKLFQPKESEIYFEANGKKCTNLISVKNLTKITNQLSTSNLIKESNGEPLKRRSRSGGWSYVNTLPLLSIQKTFIKDQLDKELEKAVSTSLRDSDELLKIRLAKAPKNPDKVQLVSYGFRRNIVTNKHILGRAENSLNLTRNSHPTRTSC